VIARAGGEANMAKTAEKSEGTDEVYSLTGTLLEACSCNVLCPCWIGEDPDLGDCRAFLSYNIESGRVQGVDVSGLSLVVLSHIPGNVLAGNWEVVVFVDDRATPEQHEALVSAFSGKLEGPLADLWQLVGTVRAVESAPISHEVSEGVGTLAIPGVLESVMEPYRSPTGDVTTLRDSVFSTVPGSPAWVSKASRHRVTLPQHGMEWEFEGRNAIQSDWMIRHTA
jgi:hypothetical protein